METSARLSAARSSEDKDDAPSKVPIKLRLIYAASLAQRKKVLLSDSQGPREKNKIAIFNAAKPCFDFGNQVFANVPSGPSATNSEHGLCPIPLIPEFSERSARQCSA